MDIALDNFRGCLVGFSTRSNSLVGGNPLDWHGLAARLGAAHAARQILAVAGSVGNPGCGSFAPNIARDLANWRGPASEPEDASSSGVNLDAKADGKPGWTIDLDSAGDDRSLVRGLL